LASRIIIKARVDIIVVEYMYIYNRISM